MSKPIEKFNLGRIQCSIWKNDGKEKSWYSAKLENVYKDGDQWKTSSNFTSRELIHLAKAALQAHSIIGELTHGQNEEDQEEQEEVA